MFLYRLIRIFRKHNVHFAIVGGYAVALHGAVRGTLDVDVILRLTKKNYRAAEIALREIGLMPRLPVEAGQIFDYRKEYIRNKNLTAWSFWNPDNPAEIVDVIITQDLKKFKIKQVRSDNHIIPILGLGDLIRMKRKSGRPQDLEDAKALEELKK